MRSISVPAGHRIAVVDDNPIVVVAETDLLEAEGHIVRSATTIHDAIELVREFEPDLLLLDYMMPDGSGADVVRAIRKFNSLTQVILVSGVTYEEPVRQLLAELDIQGFHYKSDGEFRLLLQVDAVLKHSKVLKNLARQQHYLHHTLEASLELSRLQPVQALFRTALDHLIRLVRGEAYSAESVDGLVALKSHEDLLIQTTSGDFAGYRELDEFPHEVAELIAEMEDEPTPAFRQGYMGIVFGIPFGERGCMLIRTPALPSDVVAACRLFSAQVSRALENVRLYERATVDDLTRVYNRAFGRKRLEEILKLAERTQHCTGVVLLDVDHFKPVNDTYGHAAGDVALCEIASAIVDTCRASDVVSRHGGEEFVVLLPATSPEAARSTTERILESIRRLEVSFNGQQLTLTASAGVAVAQPGETSVSDILHRADQALYESKRRGRDQAVGPATCATNADNFPSLPVKHTSVSPGG